MTTLVKSDLILDGKTITVVSHIFTTGPAQELEKYLVTRSKRVIFIGHPFYLSDKKRTYYRLYKDGKLVKEVESWFKKGRSNLYHAFDPLLTMIFLIKLHKKSDVFIGLGGLNAFCGLLLRKLGLAEKVIFYTIDYVPQRFSNPVLNKLYQWIDKVCVKNCDIVWNISPKMIVAREKCGLSRKICAPQIVVPNGANFKEIERLPITQIERRNIVLLSTLLKKQGAQLVIEALPEVLKFVPQTKLFIIGTGEYEGVLKEMVKYKGLEEHVQFLGKINDHKEVERMLAHFAIGLALYVPYFDNYSQYADPGKIKTYTACGLPVIITRVPAVAEEIEAKKAGIVINYDKNEMVRALLTLLTDDEMYIEYRKNAIAFAERYDWGIIFDEAFSKLISMK